MSATTPSNLHILPYEPAHFAFFWRIFCDYWLAVNHENLNELINLESNLVTSKVDKKLTEILANGEQIKMLVNGNPVEVVGFLHYKIHDGELPFIHSLFIRPEWRKRGFGGVLLSTLRGFDKVLFNIHTKTPPHEFMEQIGGIRRFSGSHIGDLEVWEGVLREHGGI